MDLIELYADEHAETHFRRTELVLEMRDFVPPSKPLKISRAIPVTEAIFLSAPPGWDDSFHATPRRQLAVVLSGAATVTVTDGETIVFRAGDFLLLNDAGSKGHLTKVIDEEEFCNLMVWLD